MNENDLRRWAIFSDTHGNLDAMRDALAKAGPFSAMIHLGDGVLDASAIARERSLPLTAVAGNEDGVSDYPERAYLAMGGCIALLLHGHRLDLNPYQPSVIWEKQYAAMDALMAVSGARVLLFGHTHVPVLRRTDHGIICNPGNHFIGSQTPHTFAIAESVGDVLKIRIAMKGGGGWITTDEASIRATN
ncbi:MAG TPA: metallophosphoesterase family protein [Spirochaetota bacterium]|nr:metallophosphoesterase family protein [Spirochaetota bacterium]